MAKAKHNETLDNETSMSVVTLTIPADLVLSHGDWEIDAHTLLGMTTNGLAYLLQNGFNQSMVDSAALSKEFKEGKSEKEIAAAIYEKKGARYKNILASAVGSRVGGPRVVGIDKFVKDVAIEWIKAHATSKGLKMPKGEGAAEKLSAIIDKYMTDEGRAGAVRAEAEKRMAAVEAAGDFDFTA